MSQAYSSPPETVPVLASSKQQNCSKSSDRLLVTVAGETEDSQPTGSQG